MLDELQRRGVRFSPTSTRAELEQQLLAEEARAVLVRNGSIAADSDGGAVSSSFRSDAVAEFVPASAQGGSVRQQEATQRPPRDAATRKQRPDWSNRTNNRPIEPESSGQQQQRTRQRRHMRDDNDNVAPWDAVLDWSSSYIPEAVDQVYETTRRTIRKVGQKASDYWRVDDDGVRDADFTYLYRDEDLYGRVQWLHDEITRTNSDKVNGKRTPSDPDREHQRQLRQAQGSSSRRPPSRPSSSSRARRAPEASADPVRARNDPLGRRRSSSQSQGSQGPSNSHTYNVRQDAQRRGPRQGVFTRRPFLLPPARETILPSAANATNLNQPGSGTPSPLTTASSSTSSRRPRSDRKVYSPYASRDRFDDVGDGLDRFGRFVADVADRFMWGPDDGDDRKRKSVATERQPSTKRDDTEPPDASSSPSGTTFRHWKDRLEAQFDTVLGISEDGAYYQRWADKARHDKHNEGGRDPFSVARGVQPKRRGLSSPHQRNRRYDKPIWEEEGNLVALLFGRTQSGNSLLFEKLLDPNHGSLLFLLRAVLRSLLLVGSYACRWASVRGAFPQPVVVIGVFSALVCAPRNRRMLAVGAALVFFRALGELAHGYAYGNDGWEDDADTSRRRSGWDSEDDSDDDATDDDQ
jgi:hypothetical protein